MFAQRRRIGWRGKTYPSTRLLLPTARTTHEGAERMKGALAMRRDPLPGHSGPLENEAAFPEKATFHHARDAHARFGRVPAMLITKIDALGSDVQPSGSEQAKSGSICGHERIGHPLESRTNALRSGQISAKTWLYRGNMRHQNASSATPITVKHRRQTCTRSWAMPTRAKSGSILRIWSTSVLANKGTICAIGKNQTDFWRLSRLMTHVGPVFGSQMSTVPFEVVRN